MPVSSQTWVQLSALEVTGPDVTEKKSAVQGDPQVRGGTTFSPLVSKPSASLAVRSPPCCVPVSAFLVVLLLGEPQTAGFSPC